MNNSELHTKNASLKGSLGIQRKYVADSCSNEPNKPTRDLTYQIKRELQNAYSVRESIDYDTGEILESKEYLQGRSASLCGKYCHSGIVTVKKNSEFSSATLSGVIWCSSVWSCPTCRAKIIRKRSEELQQLEHRHRESGGDLIMITYTVCHSREQSLQDIYGSSKDKTGLSGALRAFRSYSSYRKFKQECDHVADVRVVEVTHGQNGYHAHVHHLIYTQRKIDEWELDLWKEELYPKWEKACVDGGLAKPSKERGIKLTIIKEGKGDYLAKWGSAGEISSGTEKQAKNGNLTISQIENALYNHRKGSKETQPIEANRAYAVLNEFYSSMKGAKLMYWGGKKSLAWKSSLLGEELSDEDIVNGVGENHTSVAEISQKAYKIINKRRLLSELLTQTELHGYEGIQKLFDREKITAEHLSPPEKPPPKEPPKPRPLIRSEYHSPLALAELSFSTK